MCHKMCHAPTVEWTHVLQILFICSVFLLFYSFFTFPIETGHANCCMHFKRSNPLMNYQPLLSLTCKIYLQFFMLFVSLLFQL